MSYFVVTAPEVADYLAAVEGLSDADCEAIIDGYTEELGRDADHFLATRPIGHESLHFRYDYPHLTTNTLYVFDFIVDGSEMPSGVVRVVYVEHTTEPIP
jgi:hypothetical protein